MIVTKPIKKSCLFLFLSLASHVPARETVRMVHIYDANQILVTTNKGKKKIQLLGVHIPYQNEIKTKMRMINQSLKSGRRLGSDLLEIPRKAKGYLDKNLKKGDTLYVEPYQKDDLLNETPQMIIRFADLRIINIEMIRNGFARVQPEELNSKWKARFEKEFEKASKSNKGLGMFWLYEKKFLRQAFKKPVAYQMQKKIRLMNFNVENLFDTEIDPNNRNDRYFLPISLKQSRTHKVYCAKKGSYASKKCLELDWSEAKFKKKLKRIRDVIFQDKTHPPDVIILQEVENYGTLKRLRDQYFPEKDYKIHHYESRDPRGIDVAVMSRLNLAEMPQYYEIKFGRSRLTRGILQTTFFLPNKELFTIMGFHFPSQRSSTFKRAQALAFLNKLRSTLPKDRLIVSAGDCNITLPEEKKLYTKFIYRYWDVSHKIGCSGCKGTTYYPPKRSWSFFDVFYFSRSLTHAHNSSWAVRKESIGIANKVSFQNTVFGYKNRANKKIEVVIPNRYKDPDYSGVSDHWPIIVDIVRR